MTRTLLLLSMLATACVGETAVGVAYSAPAPDLVYVSPGVSVIADYDYPVFYASNFYWRYDRGVWYRSRTYRGGWAVSYDVPATVRRIDRPAAYVHYHAARSVAHGSDHRAVRDHRR